VSQEWSGQVSKISPLPGFDPRTVQPVASRYTEYANRLSYAMGTGFILKGTKRQEREAVCPLSQTESKWS
jgi:TPP-dependent indolepyruvate ferredoxin oxidoreductase alpha subunit